MSAELDWTDDEAVVRKAVPGCHLIRGAVCPVNAAIMSRGKCLHGMWRNGDEAAWKAARQHPTVQAYERAHRPQQAGWQAARERHEVAERENRNGMTYITCTCGIVIGPYHTADYAEDDFEDHCITASRLPAETPEAVDPNAAAYAMMGLPESPAPVAPDHAEGLREIRAAFEKWWLLDPAADRSYETLGDAAEAGFEAAWLACSERRAEGGK